MDYQVWISKETNNGETSKELGFFTSEQCKSNYTDWIETAKAEQYQQLILNPIGLDKPADAKKLVVKL